MKQLAEQAIERCLTLSSLTEIPGQTTRTFLSTPMHACHEAIRGWMNELGLKVWVDSIGNIRGLRPGADGEAPRLIIGSHLDSVPDAGAYDGILGVTIGLALIGAIGAKPLPFEIEVIGFSEEEGVRFGIPFLGSRALAGTLAPDVLSRTDRAGISVAQAVQSFGLSLDGLAGARLHERTAAYLEFHIEQGPVLEAASASIAPVEAIAGQSRLEFVFRGTANHAGTTPMLLRRDALAGCAQWIVEVERFARSVPGLVATVGRVDVCPGAGNVVPGEVHASLDVRHSSDAVRLDAVATLSQAGTNIARDRNLTLEQELLLDQNAIRMDAALLELLRESIPDGVTSLPQMVSGAGHDAMILAPHVPACMLFLRSPRGISHHPDEAVRVEDVEGAIATGIRFLLAFGTRYNKGT